MSSQTSCLEYTDAEDELPGDPDDINRSDKSLISSGNGSPNKQFSHVRRMLRVGRQCKTKPKRDEYVIDRSESNNE